jgi:5-methyltetrahydropteroyltriglutamate--homocysteine methyltransferase
MATAISCSSRAGVRWVGLSLSGNAAYLTTTHRESALKRSTDRILTTHPGRLPNPDNHAEVMQARRNGDRQRFDELTAAAIQDMIRRQREIGLDILSDGEFWKVRDQQWYDDRASGVVVRPLKPGEAGFNQLSARREGRMPEFKAFYEIYDQIGNTPMPGERPTRLTDMYQVITGPIQVTSGEAVRHEVERTKKAILAAGDSVEGFIFPVIGPGWLGHSLHDEYYGDRDKYNYAMAELLKNDYHAVIDAGFTLQIDDPALCTRNTVVEPPMSREEYRKDCEARIEATNWALQGIPEDRVLYHTCWGSFHTPHVTDMPFEWVADLLPKLNVGAWSVEAADVRHELDFQVFETFKLPDGKSYYPGVIAHKTSTVEPPELVAYRIVRYANLLGKENIVASVDCGVGGRCYPEIGWAKLKSLVEGARLASQQLWG